MHCSANVGIAGDVAIFFIFLELEKPLFPLIGARIDWNDEHGWSDFGVFNLEGGCMPKSFGSRRKLSLKSIVARGALVRCWKTSSLTLRHAGLISTMIS